MKTKEQKRIEELEKRLAELEPTAPALIKIRGKTQQIKYHGNFQPSKKVWVKGTGYCWVYAIPLLEVSEPA